MYSVDHIHRVASLVGVLALAGVTIDALGTVLHVYKGESIQAAIDAAADGDEIIVHPGTYCETIDFVGKAVWLHSSDGVAVTTIHAEYLERVVYCTSGEGSDTQLEGFTIQGGYVPHSEQGAGMLCIGTSPTVSHCCFFANEGYSFTSGGGMYIDGGNPTIIGCAFVANEARWGSGLCCTNDARPVVMDCAFESNLADTQGGGLSAWSESTPLVIGCTFQGNEAGCLGGGLHLYHQADAIIINCRFSENAADCGGGVEVSYQSNPFIVNCSFESNVAGDCGGGGLGLGEWVAPEVVGCTFHHNTAGEGGAIVSASNSTVTVTNCTLFENDAGEGGGLFLNYASAAVLDNCILWQNKPNEIDGTSGPSLKVSYSDICGGWAGPGNIDADPRFLDPEAANLRLSPGSPCIDAARNSAVPKDSVDLDHDGDLNEPLPLDLDGRPRFVDDPDTEDTGLGTPPLVDMGAYEFQICAADVTGDGRVDVLDLLAVLSSWGQTGVPADINFDGIVDVLDLLAVLAGWGPCG